MKKGAKIKFNLLKNKEKLKINTVKSNTNDNEKTREKFILKGWIESNRKPTCTNKRTRGFLFGAQTRFKMDFSAGRSMIEMLGVLAIIGVLSIGGIQGYTMSMRRYKANEILNTMNKYAIVLYSNCMTQMMNQEVEIWDGVISCSTTDFTDAGLGGMPNGVVSLRTLPYGENFNNWSSQVFSRKGSSGDIVQFIAEVDSKELCETMINIAGTSNTSDYFNNNGWCSSVNYVPLVFHMN